MTAIKNPRRVTARVNKYPALLAFYIELQNMYLNRLEQAFLRCLTRAGSEARVWYTEFQLPLVELR